MNERMKEFILQAGFELHYEQDGTFSYSQQFEKFAELIREDERLACLEIADYCAEAHMPSSMAANAIHARRNKE